MTSERTHRLFYAALKIFHWTLFFIIVEIMFWFAGWMIFGTLDNILAGTPFPTAEQNHDSQFSRAFLTAGKVVSVVAGIWFTRMVLRRSRNPKL